MRCSIIAPIVRSEANAASPSKILGDRHEVTFLGIHEDDGISI